MRRTCIDILRVACVSLLGAEKAPKKGQEKMEKRKEIQKWNIN
jgi:hypothetical protein